MELNETLQLLLKRAKQGASEYTVEEDAHIRKIVQTLLEEMPGRSEFTANAIIELVAAIRDRGVPFCADAQREIAPAMNAAHFLDLRDEESGLRHYLEGKPLHAGETIAIFNDAAWHLVRYEWSYDEKSLPVAWFDDEKGIRIKPDMPCRFPA